MERAYNKIDLHFEKEFMKLNVDDQFITLRLSDVSDKLAKASEEERIDYKVSPSGFGIHWRLIDEDLSINGLLKLSNG